MTSPLIGLIVNSSGTVLSEQIATALSSLSIPTIDPSIAIDSLPEGQFVLLFDENGLSMAHTGRKQPGNIYVDFVNGSAKHRRQFGGGKSQMIAKAIGLKTAFKPNVLDLTAGLGQDGFVLACLGCQMTLVERSPIIYALLSDGLSRGLNHFDDGDLQATLQKIQLLHANGSDFLESLTDPVDVVYLDPMFPERQKSAKVKKEMRAFHQIVGHDHDAGELLVAALKLAKYRVVVKRPRVAPALHEQYPDCALPAPGLVLSGKTSRYDIYPLAKMPSA